MRKAYQETLASALQALIDIFHSGQPIPQDHLAFALGLATGLYEENKTLRQELIEARREIDRLKQTLPSATA